MSERSEMKKMLSTAAVIVVSAVLLSACGLPEDRSPREIAAGNVPFGLLGPTTTTPGNTNVPGGTEIKLYFVDGAKLREVKRTVPRSDVRLVLDELVHGVSET